MIISETITANADLVTTVTVFVIWGIGWALFARNGNRQRQQVGKS